MKKYDLYTCASVAVVAYVFFCSAHTVHAQEFRQKDIEIHTVRIFDSGYQAALPPRNFPGQETVHAMLASEGPGKDARAYTNYYKLIRKKICEELEESYESGSDEGDVDLVFVLNSSGSLAGLDIGRTTDGIDPYLCKVARASVRDAGPFPPFPKELTLSQMTFTVTVSFRRQ